MRNSIIIGSWVVAGVAMLLLALHTAGVSAVKVDNTSVLLLIIAIVCLLAPWLTKIRFGEFEAEIGPKEVGRLKEKVDKHIPEPPEAKDTALAAERTRAAETISDLVIIDPVLALAKLRIELEKVLTTLYEAAGIPERLKRPVSASKLVRRLTDIEVIPKELSGAIIELIQLCNRAIHGEDIRPSQAEAIVDQGARLLEYLYDHLSEFRFEPKGTQEINKEELGKYMEAKYRVVTVIPYVDKPVRITRVLNQEAFDRFLEGYEEYAEFIVEVSKIAE